MLVGLSALVLFSSLAAACTEPATPRVGEPKVQDTKSDPSPKADPPSEEQRPASEADDAARSKAQILILTGDKTKEGAAQKLSQLQLPAAFVPRAGWPKVIDSTTVAGLKPGLHVVVLGICQALAPYERKLDDDRELYFQWQHHDVLIAKMRAAVPGAYGKQVETAQDACPVWRGTKPKDGALAAAWQKLATQPDDVPSWLRLFDTANDPDTATYFTERVLLLDPTNEEALGNVGG
jgi:hypothetical protein